MDAPQVSQCCQDDQCVQAHRESYECALQLALHVVAVAFGGTSVGKQWLQRPLHNLRSLVLLGRLSDQRNQTEYTRTAQNNLRLRCGHLVTHMTQVARTGPSPTGSRNRASDDSRKAHGVHSSSPDFHQYGERKHQDATASCGI